MEEKPKEDLPGQDEEEKTDFVIDTGDFYDLLMEQQEQM